MDSLFTGEGDSGTRDLADVAVTTWVDADLGLDRHDGRFDLGVTVTLDGKVTVTRGIIFALDRSIDVENGQLSGLIQTDAAISSGNSGGPLMNSQGEIGMNSAGATSSGSVTAENIGFSIAINHAMTIVAQLRTAA